MYTTNDVILYKYNLDVHYLQANQDVLQIDHQATVDNYQATKTTTRKP